MNHKEKAKALVEEFKKMKVFAPENVSNLRKMLNSEAEQCALIAVDELIQEHTWKSPIGWNITRMKDWQQVRKEIEQL